jgi:hypothetical protein
LGDGVPVRLAGPGHLSMSVEIYFRVARDLDQRHRWEARTAGYMYALYDRSGREVLAYHWHPEGRSHITAPHLHLGAGAEVSRRDLADAHLPTGDIALEDVLRLAITDLGVRPLRRNWSDILDRTRRSGEESAT